MTCRLLYLVGRLGPGGAERQLFYLLRTLDRERYRPAVVVWNDRTDDPYLPMIRALGIPCYPIATALRGPAKMRVLRRMVRQLQPEVIHSYSFYTNIAAQWATRGMTTIPIGSLRGEFGWSKRELGRWLGNISARWPRTQICNSVAAFNEMRQARTFFAPPSPFVVGNGLDLAQFPEVPVPHRDPPVIVGVGSLLPVKRWDLLIAAAVALKSQGHRFQVRIVGDGPLRASLTQHAQALGVADCVQLLGRHDDVSQVLREARFVTHTSDSEGCPNAVMEAMACGRAVVATDVGDVSLLLDEAKTGFVVPRGSVTALATRMATLLSHYELCQRMGGAARLKAEQMFNLTRLVSETFAVYRAAGWKDS